MKYELYHDESLIDGYWHGMLLVPVSMKQDYFKQLELARKNTGYSSKIGIKGVKKKGKIYGCASAWIQIANISLRSISKGKESIWLGKREKGGKIYEALDLTGMKFILFRERDSHDKLANYRDYGAKMETTFRFGLKGGLHFLGSDEEPIEIEKIHFDGHEHIQRHLDKSRIIDRLGGLREYCSISPRDDLIDDRSSNHNKSESQEYDDCQFLQLTDLLIGTFRTVFGHRTRQIHSELAKPIRLLAEVYERHPAGKKHSRWHNSFALSQCYLEDELWKFEGLVREQNCERQLEFPEF